MRRDRIAPLLVLGLLSSCMGPHAAVPTARKPQTATARLLFGGDVMLGRGVGQIVESDRYGVLADVRYVVSSADLAVANLESPLTTRAHIVTNPNALEAPPSSANLLAQAGFDAMTVANNHAGDGGPETVTDTLRALGAAGLRGIGGGSDAAQAFAPTIFTRGGVRVALFGFDATGQAARAGSEPGVAWWDEARVGKEVAAAREAADVVVVGLHAGAEYHPGIDPYTMAMARSLARMGADVVWASGPHVVQPVRLIDPDRDGRPTLVATSLGNFLFDQSLPGTQAGLVVEALVGADGLVAWRAGSVALPDRRAHFDRWRAPRGDAVALDGEWWTLARPVDASPTAQAERLPPFPGPAWAVVDSAIGDADGDGSPEVVVSFRRPGQVTRERSSLPDHRWMDALGRSAHLGLWSASDLHPVWVAGTLVRPVVELAACDGALAVAYSRLNRDRVIATGAWFWNGFGFASAPDLAGRGLPRCADVDGDGRADPVILGRR